MNRSMRRRKTRRWRIFWDVTELLLNRKTQSEKLCLLRFISCTTLSFLKLYFGSAGFKSGWNCLEDCEYYSISFLELIVEKRQLK